MSFDILVLAAGKGERMRSELPKPLQRICGATLLELVLNLASTLSEQAIVVLGWGGELVKEELKRLNKKVTIVEQKEQLGTADAVRVALPHIKKENAVVLYADVPLIKRETLSALIEEHTKSGADVTLLSAFVKDPRGYGRIIRKDDSICAIVEEAEIKEEKEKRNEIFTGVAAYRTGFLEKVLPLLKPSEKKGEYYLTDVVRHTKKISSVLCEEEEALGINEMEQLVKAESLLQQRLRAEAMKKGARMAAPELVYIEYGVEIEGECVIEPFCVIRRGVRIGKGCEVGPFSHLRKGTILKEGSEVGNFVETKNTVMGEKAKAKHLSYLGDSEIGAEANIGAGTICANYDGVAKHKTVIGKKASVGSGTVLIAPVRIGEGAITGAGAVVTKNRDVAPGETVVGVPARALKKSSKKR